MNTISLTNNRLMATLIAILVVTLLVLILNVFFWLSMLSGGMMNRMMGINGQTMNDTMSACAEMMQNFQSP